MYAMMPSFAISPCYLRINAIYCSVLVSIVPSGSLPFILNGKEEYYD